MPEPEPLQPAPRPQYPDEPPEPSLEEQLRLVQELLDLVPDFFYVHSFDMRFWYANKHAAEYFGVAKDELVGRLLIDVDSRKEQAAQFVEVCQQVMREGKPRLTDGLRYTRPDGTPGFLRQHDIPFKNPINGEPMLLGMSRDVTAERELLEERVRRATLERELEIAREIQRSLRPAAPPRSPGLDFAAYSEPATYAGGDFYDWWRARDGRTFICIGDVTGHGVGPALIAAECRAYARTLLDLFPLESALPRLADAVSPGLEGGKFVTFAAVEIAPDAASARVLSAGHGPLLMVRGEGATTQSIPTHAPPLGVPGFDFDAPTKLAMAAGDSLVLVSDGVVESRRHSGEQFGTERLKQALLRYAGLTRGDAVERIVEDVCAFAEQRPADDDVTLVIVGRG